MIILPDRNIPRARFLMPMQRRSWLPSSQAIEKDQFGHDATRTFYRARARLSDGHVAWTGWFQDREDFDAFLFAVFSGSLAFDRSFWRLPTPEWHPGIYPGLVYDFATITFLTSTVSATYTSPVDWDNANNYIEGIGAGGSGARAANSGFSANKNTGGGGGEYRKTANFTFASPGTSSVSYICGAGGGSHQGSTSAANGFDGGNSVWDAGAALTANGGSGGQTGTTSTVNGGAGGTGGTGSAANFNGGRGGNSSFTSTATGGGGAAGPSGAGVNGTDAASANSSTGGGAGGNGSGGAGGANAGGNGVSGTEWDASHGSGGGSGGNWGSIVGTTVAGGTAGLYGAGSGAGQNTGNGPGQGRAGRLGLFVVTYTPLISVGLKFSMAMMGM